MASQEGSRQPVVHVAEALRQDAIDTVPVVESAVPISQEAAARGNRQASMRAWHQDLEEQSAKTEAVDSAPQKIGLRARRLFPCGGQTNKDGLPKDEVVRSHGT